MLRDLSPFDRHDSVEAHFFMNAVVSEPDLNDSATTADTLDDIFGSPPSSPITGPQDQSSLPHHAPASEPSDIPRLRSIHVTNGYREGIAASKETSIQEGFDEGYSLGAEIGLKAGWCLGTLEGICYALASTGNHVTEDQTNGEPCEEMLVLLGQAQEELSMDHLLSSDYFKPDGTWFYHVPGDDTDGADADATSQEDAQISFSDVAVSHPLIKKWRAVVLECAQKFRLELEVTK